jgi:hypothetical protein
MIAVSGSVPCRGETLEEELVPPLPGSEQFKLQHSRAIETSGEVLADCAFLQQSGRFDIGQEPSCSCAPTPTAPPSMAATRVKAVSNFRIDVVDYIHQFPYVSSTSHYHLPGFSHCFAERSYAWMVPS